ncbi:MAG: 50S ribosomal protein L22 [Candidatus Paceibacterota bacterium]|jgi:large subunit ribosomal protein L22
MLVSAKLRYLRISPRKARLVADLVRGKSVEQAQGILNFTIKRAANPILKLLNSAAANAKNNFHLDPKNMYVARIFVNEGATYKRVMPRARGTANQIHKKTCHIDLVLAQNGEKVGMPTRNDFKVKTVVNAEKIQAESKPEAVKEKKVEKTAKPKAKETKKDFKPAAKKVSKNTVKK